MTIAAFPQLALALRLAVSATLLTAPVSPLAGIDRQPASTALPSATASQYAATTVGFAEGADPSDGGLARRLDGIREFAPAGRPIIRVDLDWAYVEPCRGCPLRWDRTDAVVREAAARNMRVLMILAYAPPWATGGHDTDKWFPTNDDAWTSIVAQAVSRYEGRVDAYEVWNEPNNEAFGKYAGDRKARYWQLVSLAYRSIRSGCATCVVLAGASSSGAASGEPLGNPDESAVWLDWAYQNGYGQFFDAVAHHPYPAANSGYGPAKRECVHRWWNMFGPPEEDHPCGELAYVRSVMVRNGDAAKKIWATEWGYPTSGTLSHQPLATVRNFLVQGVHMWRALSYAGPLFLYSYRDACADATDMECNFGVVREDFTLKEPLYSHLSAALSGWSASLFTGGSLYSGQAMRSPNGAFELWLQSDGNLVLYSIDGTVLWDSGTRGAIRLHNQPDGDLVLHSSDGGAIWSTGTRGSGPSTLWLQDDGNLVLYADGDAEATWASKGE